MTHQKSLCKHGTEERLAGMAKKEKTIKGWKVIIETDEKVHGLKKNKNKFCKDCVDKKDCRKGRTAMIANCEEYRRV